MCIQLEKLQEFAASLKATDDHNFQYAGNNIEKIIAEKVYTVHVHNIMYFVMISMSPFATLYIIL